MKLITTLLLFLTLQAIAGGPFWQGLVEDYSVKKSPAFQKVEFIRSAMIGGSLVETNSQFVSLLINRAMCSGIEVRVSSYRLDVRDITETGIFVGSATLVNIDAQKGQISKIQAITEADAKKYITKEELKITVNGKTKTIKPSVFEAIEIITIFENSKSYDL